jgi:hypothetical protein
MLLMARRVAAGLVAALAAGALAGCGSSQPSRQGPDPVLRAADVTAQVPGYRMHGTITMSTQSGQIQSTVSGYVDRLNHTGQMVTRESVLGHTITVTEKFSRLTVYMQAAGSQLAAVSHGRPWLKLDMSKMLSAMGFGALPTSGDTDPSQFVDYLRAVGAHTTRVGAATIGGVATTHYRAIIDLDRYAQVVRAAQRAAAAKGVQLLEATIGSHSLPVDVWIDSHRLIRQMSFSFPECVEGQHLHASMVFDVAGYGPQPTVTMPSAGQAFDLTPLISAKVGKIKLGCSSAA